MRILITGAFGFAGCHLIRELIRAGHEPFAFDLKRPDDDFKNIRTFIGDIRDAAAVEGAVSELRPDACIHLSAISFVPEGWSDIRNVFAVNLTGTINIIDAIRKNTPETRLLVISSSEVYGHLPRGAKVKEDDPLAPDNPYAVSKAAADFLALSCARQHGLRAMTARPGNHIGPGQSAGFVAPAIARQIAAIARGSAPPVVETGNLDSKRDFTDVRDMVRAYRLLIEKGKQGRAYNIASGRTTAIRELLEEFCAIAGVKPRLKTNPDLVRREEARPVLDTGRIREEAGWTPVIEMPETLRCIMEDAEKSFHG